jgi:hypothetical protein
MEALNLNTMAELERDIEATLAAKIEAGRGCFGTILFNANDDVTCGACDLFAACEEAHAANRMTVLKSAEAELEAEEAKLAAVSEPAPEPVVEPVAQELVDIDVNALSGKSRKKQFDWDKAINGILAAKPTLFKEAAAICKDALLPEWAWADATAYGNCNKILGGLAKAGAVNWAPKGKTIEWLR